MTTFEVAFPDGTIETVMRPELYSMIRTFLREHRGMTGEQLDRCTLTAMSIAETREFIAISLSPRKVYWTARLITPPAP